MDAIASPFVQGRLSQDNLTAVVRSRCAQSGRQLTIDIDQQLRCRPRQTGARPLVFAPLQLVTPGAPSIIDGF